jgi:hypothetical protein
MRRDVHFEVDAHARFVRMQLSDRPTPNRIAIGDIGFLFTVHFNKSGSGGDDGRESYSPTTLICQPALTSHGAITSADLVSRLAGSRPGSLIANWRS